MRFRPASESPRGARGSLVAAARPAPERGSTQPASAGLKFAPGGTISSIRSSTSSDSSTSVGAELGLELLASCAAR